MSYYRKTIVPNIEAHYENLSAVEKNIADFFISNEEDMDFSSRHISSMLYVSEASLSRFAKNVVIRAIGNLCSNTKNRSEKKITRSQDR